MPSGTSVQQFIDDLNTGKTTVARAFDDLFGTPSAIAMWKDPSSHLGQHLGDLDNPDFAANPLPQWAVDELKKAPGSSRVVTRPLTDNDIAHINDWPVAQRDRLREAVWQALDNNRCVQFFWELWDGNQTDIKIHPPAGQGGTGDIIVTFRTPRKKLRYLGAEQVQIDVP